jgi:hypothetical protein
MEIERSDSGVTISMEELEVRILQDLAAQLLNLTATESGDTETDPLALMVGIDSNATKPTDPVLGRLYPDAYPDDPEASLEFRRFTERSLRDASTQRAERIVELISGESPVSTVELTGDLWNDMVGFLNDLRLALGTRLEITESLELHEIADTDPKAALFDLYGWLTWMQEMLIARGFFDEN